MWQTEPKTQIVDLLQAGTSQVGQNLHMTLPLAGACTYITHVVHRVTCSEGPTPGLFFYCLEILSNF